ncbi:Conserved DNA-binding protein YbaB [Asanoa hainanensis]|uniref:Conserved DNA-binding protein YbaB n=1 Tax=Asanoa hainanensis TaxID=560556 RepID=A0A239G9D4_9ACTN|nr:YbaB/EbfC family nucleoid-associated protein [Asanoa hainanensis]SNS65711.1 Conserved DNA-binding protein YbaB [Asanoa hainanensis]
MYDEQGLEQQLREARTALRQARTETGDAPAPEEITAEAADGQVRVTLDASGRLTAIDIRPTILRHGTESLAEALMAAVNEALDTRAATTGGGQPAPDLDAMSHTIERLQDESLRQMRQITAAFTEATRRNANG